MALSMEVGRSPGDLVLDEDTAPYPEKGWSSLPKFSVHFYSGQTVGFIKMPLGVELGLIIRDFVFDGDPAPSPKSRRGPQFSAHVYCGQTAAWIKMPLGT